MFIAVGRIPKLQTSIILALREQAQIKTQPQKQTALWSDSSAVWG